MDEQQAIARLRQGEIDGLAVLVRNYQVRAVRAATLITHDRTLAEDIVQAAFIRAYERIEQFDPARPFGPWFLRSVVNDAVKAVTRRRAPLDDPPDTLSDPAPGPDELLEQAETEQAVWAALGQLPPDQRAVVVLRYYLGLSEAEIASEQAVPRGTIKWRLHAARERLRALLTPWRLSHQPDFETLPLHGEAQWHTKID
jgi:RNA polymerase sigma-70 factor (ECF subfamily)